jgi:aminoglycoside phosphotransferase
MKQNDTRQYDGTLNAGRKGVAYDWQSLLVTAEAASLELEFSQFTPQFAQLASQSAR